MSVFGELIDYHHDNLITLRPGQPIDKVHGYFSPIFFLEWEVVIIVPQVAHFLPLLVDKHHIRVQNCGQRLLSLARKNQHVPFLVFYDTLFCVL